MKQILILCSALLLFVACSDNEQTPQPEPTKEYAAFVGELENTPLEGSHFTPYSESDVEFDLVPAGEKMNLMMPRIRFVEQMPVWIPMEIRAIEVERQADALILTLEETTPYFHGLPYDPDGKNSYQITQLEGRYDLKSHQLSLRFNCMTMLVHFEGEWERNSLQIL